MNHPDPPRKIAKAITAGPDQVKQQEKIADATRRDSSWRDAEGNVDWDAYADEEKQRAIDEQIDSSAGWWRPVDVES